MRLIGLLFIAASFISWAQAQDVVCSKKMRKVVVVNEGDSFSFSTQEGEAYAAKSKCQVVYKKDPTCPSNKKKHAAGAVCTAECVSGEEPVTTTPTTGST